MEKLTYFNTLINILLVGWWVYRNNRLYICVSRTSRDKVFVGINVMWNRRPLRKGLNATGLFYIPLRNSEKLETREDVMYLISRSNQEKTQNLGAMFSWLKTDEEVQKFKKDYLTVDERLVRKLVREFELKNI